MKYVRDLSKVPYLLPKRTPGGRRSSRLPMVIDPLFQRAITEIAAAESRKYGVKISPATLLFNLSMYGMNELRTASADLRRKYEQLNKEDTHHVSQAQTAESSSDA